MTTYKGIIDTLRLVKEPYENVNRVKISSSKDVHEYALHFFNGDIELIEHFHLLLLNRANNTIGHVHLSQGGMSGTVADPKVVFMYALKAAACSIILIHNHPSGQTKPSEADRKLTRKLKDAGELLDLPILDHIIVTSENYYSFADNGEI